MQGCPCNPIKVFKYIFVYDLFTSTFITSNPCHTKSHKGYRLLIYMVPPPTTLNISYHKK